MLCCVKSFEIFLQTSLWSNLDPQQIIGTPAVIKEIDCSTATVEEISEVSSTFSLPIHVDRTQLSALAGWFDVHFRVGLPLLLGKFMPAVRFIYLFILFKLFQGSKQNPAMHDIELTTAPNEENPTHWGQQVCSF